MDFLVVPTARFRLWYAWFVIGHGKPEIIHFGVTAHPTSLCVMLLDHVIIRDEKHLQRLLREYADYYNADRVHTELQDSPMRRPTEHRPSPEAQDVGLPRVGGLHDRYE